MKRTRGRSLELLLAAVALAAACSSSGGSTTPDTGPPPADQDVTPVEVTPPPEPECVTSEDCMDKVGELSLCQVAVCLPGVNQCGTTPVNDGTACEDGDMCTSADVCLDGECAPGSMLACDDENQCTTDSCDPASGCVFDANTLPCDDGNVCTMGDECKDEQCESGVNECKCESEGDCMQYDDDNLCNGVLFCDTSAELSTCEVDPSSVVTCPDSEAQCQTMACSPDTGECGMAPAPDGGACDDGDACTYADACTGGICAGTKLDCDDENPCTTDSCDVASGCSHTISDVCGDCTGMACLACSFGAGCAEAGPFIGETCCASGDPIIYLSPGTAAEAVDIETDGTFVFLCGGFGVRVNDVSNPAAPQYVDSAVSRCQRVGIGELLPNGNRVVYLAHHGDSWVNSPSLWTYQITPEGNMKAKGQEADSEILFEGLAWNEGYLYVAAHDGGVRVYETDEQGLPYHQHTVTGFVNAWKIDIEGNYAYVADMEGGLKVMLLGADGQAEIVAAAGTNGKARDVDAFEGRVYVALGGEGLDVFDISTPDAPVLERHLEAQGSVQAVSADSGILAVAEWSHVAVRDPVNLQLLGTERVRKFPAFDQVLGVATVGDIVMAAEWEGLHVMQYRPGYVAPDIRIDDEIISFAAGESDATALIVRNRGLLDLEVSDVSADHPEIFQVDKGSFTIPPDGADVVEVTYAPGQSGGLAQGYLTLTTNDPDSAQSPYKVLLVAGETNKIDVGDPLNSSFAFLDPSGENLLENLEGKVIVLAYFALF